MDTNPIRLTQYSHGAGCGCKISPAILDQILASKDHPHHPNLLVGYEHKDDAAVLDLKDGTAIISTTDFFMPIVDDPYDFGRIASVNAISDVYAMGGTPILAVAILGWPVDKLGPDIAAQVIEGARAVCKEAGIPLAGGHSIDTGEPIFGLAVTGKVNISDLKTNAGAKDGDLLYLTKGLGVGVLTTAEKKSLLSVEHADLAKTSMLKLNSIGAILGTKPFVHSITDVTGFGLCGHLIEMCEASNLNALLHYVKLPVLDPCVLDYIQQGAVPGGTNRNWKSYGHKVKLGNSEWFKLLADPQTSGGLLVAVDPLSKQAFETILNQNNIEPHLIGQMRTTESSNESIVLTIV